MAPGGRNLIPDAPYTPDATKIIKPKKPKAPAPVPKPRKLPPDPVGANEYPNYPVVAGTGLDARPNPVPSHPAPSRPSAPASVPAAGGAPPAAPGGAGGGAPTVPPPTAPAAPAAPGGAPAAPAAAAPTDWWARASKVLKPYVQALDKPNEFGVGWARAGRIVNNELNHAAEGQRDDASSAFQKYLRHYAQDYAANQLQTQGSINTTIHDNPVPTNETVVIPNALTDPTYVADMAGYRQTLGDTRRASDMSRRDATAKYLHDVGDMGYNNTTKQWDYGDTQKDFGSAYRNQLEDFGSRGMLQSTIYNTALANLLRTFRGRQGDLHSQLEDVRHQADTNYTNAQGLYGSQQTAELARAVQRIMQDKGVAIGDVPTTGTGSRTITRPIGGH